MALIWCATQTAGGALRLGSDYNTWRYDGYVPKVIINPSSIVESYNGLGMSGSYTNTYVLEATITGTYPTLYTSYSDHYDNEPPETTYYAWFGPLPSTLQFRGTVTVGGEGLEAALVTAGEKAAGTESDGTYVITSVPTPFTGTIIPTKTNYIFTPASTAHAGIYLNVDDNDFTGEIDVNPPTKASNPTPTDDQEDILIAGKDKLTQLTWDVGAGEAPYSLVYFRAQGDSWVLQETITNGSTSHNLSSNILNTLAYYSIYEWRVDTYNPGVELTTTGDTWTFISQQSPQYTDYTRRSDYDEDKVWEPGTGWVDIDSFEYTGGGRFKGRVLVIGHKVLYFGDI